MGTLKEKFIEKALPLSAEIRQFVKENKFFIVYKHILKCDN
jgi:hypothetical protein